MALPIAAQDLGANPLMVLLDMRSPKPVLDSAIILGSNIELGQPGFAAQLLPDKNRAEESGTIDQTILQGPVTTWRSGRSAPKTD